MCRAYDISQTLSKRGFFFLLSLGDHHDDSDLPAGWKFRCRVERLKASDVLYREKTGVRQSYEDGQSLNSRPAVEGVGVNTIITTSCRKSNKAGLTRKWV